MDLYGTMNHITFVYRQSPVLFGIEFEVCAVLRAANFLDHAVPIFQLLDCQIAV